MAHGLEQAPHLAVATFGDDHPVPVVDTLATTVFEALECGALAVDLDTLEQPRLGRRVEHAQRTHGVLALDAETRVHQLVGKFTGIGEQQQPFGVDVQPAHRLPLALGQPRQAAEHRGPLLRVVVRDDFAHGLVISQYPRRRRRDAKAHRLAVDGHPVAERNALPGMRRLAVHGDALLDDHLLQVAARTHTRLRQHLVQLGSVWLGQQHALAGVLGGFFDHRLGVVGARQHFSEYLADFCGGWARRRRVGGFDGALASLVCLARHACLVVIAASHSLAALGTAPAAPAVAATARAGRPVAASVIACASLNPGLGRCGGRHIGRRTDRRTDRHVRHHTQVGSTRLDVTQGRGHGGFSPGRVLPGGLDQRCVRSGRLDGCRLAWRPPPFGLVGRRPAVDYGLGH